MKIKVLMLAFAAPGQIRFVEIPDDTKFKDILDATFKYGQNEIQPQECCSVSVSDVIIRVESNIEVPYLVTPLGFKRLTLVEFRNYLELNQLERISFSLGCSGDTQT